MHYDVLLKKEPDNIEYLYNSGVAQMALGHLNEALMHFEHLLNIEQNHPSTLNNLAAIYIKMEQKEKAQQYLERALALDPKDTVSAHMLHALKGDKAGETNPEYALNLFNNYALYYDQHMQGLLRYSLPQHIARILHKLELPQRTHTLDLGCGTGLTGIVLRELSTHLTGVDISAKMLAQAKEKSIYDNLVEAELSEFLKKNKSHYDLITAADVLPYFGDLAALVHAIKHHLKPKGYFIFTTEISNTMPWFLEPSARFSHHPDYIKNLALENQLQLIEQQKIPARIHNHNPLEVMLYVLVNPLLH
jgi:predicted TPR repeat methyltransferase